MGKFTDTGLEQLLKRYGIRPTGITKLDLAAAKPLMKAKPPKNFHHEMCTCSVCKGNK